MNLRKAKKLFRHPKNIYQFEKAYYVISKHNAFDYIHPNEIRRNILRISFYLWAKGYVPILIK